MLSVKEAIEQRRSIRQFKDTAVPDDFVIQILEAARLAPSSANLQPWYFVVVKDQSKKNELSEICWGQRDIADAPVDIVCFADYNPAGNAFHYFAVKPLGGTVLITGNFHRISIAEY